MEYLLMATPPKRPRRLKGRGPTPKAADRPYHKAAKFGKRKRTSDGPRSRSESASDERARSDRPRGERRRDDRPRSDRPRSDRPRSDRPRSDRPRGERRREEFEKVHVDTIAGRNAVLEALRAEVPVKELIAAVGIDIDDRVQEIVDLARSQGIAIREIPRHKLDSMSGITNHQGIALVAKPFAYSSQKEIFSRVKERPLFVAVDGVTDPRNIGAIIRSAVAFGADGIFIPERRNASITGAAWKASAGAVARVPIAQVTNLVRSIEDAKELGCFVVGLDSDAKDDVSSISVASEGLYLVVGGEGKGLSRLVREHCDLIAAIPISTKVESLNASVATSIALYEIAKRRASNE